jgi:hypothetical protein
MKLRGDITTLIINSMIEQSKEIKRNLSSKAMENIKNAGVNKIQSLVEKRYQPLDIELAADLENHLLYTPSGKELERHIETSLGKKWSIEGDTKINIYCAANDIDAKTMSDAFSRLRIVPKELKRTVDSITIYTIGTIGSTKDTGEIQSLRVPLTNSSIKYSLLPLRSEARGFFPEYRKPFQIVAGKIVLESYVASRNNADTQGSGNYIYSEDRGFSKAYAEMGATKDSVVLVTKVGREKYKMILEK